MISFEKIFCGHMECSPVFSVSLNGWSVGLSLTLSRIRTTFGLDLRLGSRETISFAKILCDMVSFLCKLR
jgi:hypothetical protein